MLIPWSRLAKTTPADYTRTEVEYNIFAEFCIDAISLFIFQEGSTALLFAASAGYTNIAHVLTENGADVNTKNKVRFVQGFTRGCVLV